MTHPNSTSNATASSAQRTYQSALDEGRFLIQRCDGCQRAVFYPRELCPHCDSATLPFVPISGLGTVYAVTTVRRKADAGGDLNISLIDLDEGVRMMSRVEGLAPEAVHIGQRVRSRVVQHQGRGLVVFDPLEEAAP